MRLASYRFTPSFGKLTSRDVVIICRHRRLLPVDMASLVSKISSYSKDGAKVTTRIKKVNGDTDAFLSELRSVLQLPKPKNARDDAIRIRTGGTIEIKGNRVLEVKTWLAGLGF